jgi:hypothetical protein
MGPNSLVSSGYGSIQNWTMAMGLTIQKTQTVDNGWILPTKTWQFKFLILAPSKYLSSDCIMT